MGIHGWRLYNCPERMSYSATPPDFGSLCIQRRRWANGGLLILPKLRRQSRARRTRGQRTRFGELFLRWNYMASISLELGQPADPAGLPVQRHADQPAARPGRAALLPGHGQRPALLRLQADRRVPHLRLQPDAAAGQPGRHGVLGRAGHHRVQGRRSPRTPKVRNRTVVAAVLRDRALPGDRAGRPARCYIAYRHHQIENMAYAALNVILACYAVKAFIGLRNSVVDAWIHATWLLFKPARRAGGVPPQGPRAAVPPPPSDWRTVLEVGLHRHRPVVTAGWFPRPRPGGPARSRSGQGRLWCPARWWAGGPGPGGRPGAPWSRRAGSRGRRRGASRGHRASRGGGCPCCASSWPCSPGRRPGLRRVLRRARPGWPAPPSSTRPGSRPMST